MPWQRILVTGATSGIGHYLACEWKRRGAQLLATGRDVEQLEKLKQKGLEIEALDLSLSSGIDRVRELIGSWRPDLIIHCAGYTHYGIFHRLPWEEIVKEHRLNTESCLGLLHAHIQLAEQHPASDYCFLAVSSAIAYTPSAGMSSYSCAKSWMLTLTKLLDIESPTNMRILCSTPGAVSTQFQLRASSGHFQEKSWGTLSCEEAGQKIMRQIDKKIREQPIGLMAWIAKIASYLIPTRLAAKILLISVAKRF